MISQMVCNGMHNIAGGLHYVLSSFLGYWRAQKKKQKKKTEKWLETCIFCNSYKNIHDQD